MIKRVMKHLLAAALGLGLAQGAYAKIKVKEGEVFPLEKVSQLKPFAGKNQSLKGKVVLVDFWASWCGPCKQALPAYEALYKKHVKQGFVVVGVNVDDDLKDGKDFLKDQKVSFLMSHDNGKKLVDAIGVETMPTSFLIGKDGKIKLVHQGYRQGDDSKLAKEIESLLK